MTTLPCTCEAAGYCPVYKRVMAPHQHAICSGERLTAAQQEVYKQNWLTLSGQGVHPSYCLYRGDQVREVGCHLCGNRGKKVAVHQCAIFGECSLDQHQVGQAEHVCHDCTSHTGPLRPKWDRRIEGLYPEEKNQNFNCSLILHQGRRLLCYRHHWGNAKLGLCELDANWRPLWNCLIRFPPSEGNTAQEDPRLFVFRGELHVAYTTFRRTLKNGVQVGYASLHERAPGVWEAGNVFLPHYPQRQSWEKNWSFFESDNGLWCIYDSQHHTILEVTGNRAEFAYTYPGPTIPGNFGDCRGGPSPQRIGDRMFAFPHFRLLPKTYTMGLYTFNPLEPFEPRERCPYPVLHADPLQNSNDPTCAHVAFPCGAQVIGKELIVSYGAYDKECRLAGYDLSAVRAAPRPYKSGTP